MDIRDRSWVRRAIVPVGALALVLGCAEAPTAVDGGDDLTRLPPGIHPVLVVTEQGGGEASVTLQLKRVQVQQQVASYQGELTYDAAALTLRDAAVPAGISGMWHEPEQGRIRFAGAAVDGLGEGAVLTLRFATRERVEAADFSIGMEELVSTESFGSLTAQVQPRERPLLTRTR